MSLELLGERRALSLFALGFATTLFIIVALAMGGAWARCFFALAAVYGVGFFAVAAEYFWARWYAMGVGASGVTMAVLGLVTGGWNWGLVVWGAVHLAIYLPLLGESMAGRYENQEAWRARYNMDEYGVARLKRAVKGAATALPTLVFYALAPRQDSVAAVGLLALAAIGLVGLVRMRFWGVALLGVATVWAAVSAATALPSASIDLAGGSLALPGIGLLAALFLALSVAPFVVPTIRVLRGPSR